MKLEVKKLVKKDVIAWFKKQGKTVVGMPGEADSCPLAGYYQSKGVKDIQVDGHQITYSISIDQKVGSATLFGDVEVAVPAPKWAYKFVKIVDDSKDRDGYQKYENGVTGTEAAKILRNIR
jgi:hypothetical protein